MTTEKSTKKTCILCGQHFYTENEDQEYCPACENSAVRKEHEIIEYLREHPGISILEVSMYTKLSKQTLIRMAHEGRFKGIPLSKDFGYPCATCGKLINFGTYCPDCFSGLKKDAKNAKNAEFLAKAKAAQQSKDRARTFSHGMQDEIKSRAKDFKK